MTEQEWLSSTDPQRMITWLNVNKVQHGIRGITLERKLRMFKAAKFRAIQPHTAENEQTAMNVEKDPRWENMSWLGNKLLPNAIAAALLRDVIGNPFQKIWNCHCDPDVGIFTCEWCDELWGWKKWNDGCISVLTRQMYDSQDFSRMPLLGDMLEDAGCTDGQILEHCRSTKRSINTGPGDYGDEWLHVEEPHVRGCWVIDLLLESLKNND